MNSPCIENCDCVEGMARLPDGSVDLVVTSPPYDGIRKYNGFACDLHKVGEQVFRVLKDGGVCAMVINDQTVDGHKSLTTYRTIIDWCDNIGFGLFENCIYHKHGAPGAWWNKRFRVDHEYMPIFVKGRRPAYFDKEPLMIPAKWAGVAIKGSANRKTDGTTMESRVVVTAEKKCRGTVWDYMECGDKNPLKRKHPATFPDRIPMDFIKCFCQEGGTVLDPFTGSGTTAVAARKLGRDFIGFEISAEYCRIAEERLRLECGTIQGELQI